MAVVPKPTDAGMPFDDITLTTPDGLKLKAYVIPARQRVVPLNELRGMSQRQMAERGQSETVSWELEKGTKAAMDVRFSYRWMEMC